MLACDPPFPPLGRKGVEGLSRTSGAVERVVGVLLVRLGGHAAGVFKRAAAGGLQGRQPLREGRHKKGGSSQRRFERRREEQAWMSLEQAADTRPCGCCSRTVEHLDALVLGGDRSALREVMEDHRLRPLRALMVGRARRRRAAAEGARGDAGRVPCDSLTVGDDQPHGGDRAHDDDDPAQRDRRQPPPVHAAELAAGGRADRDHRRGAPTRRRSRR